MADIPYKEIADIDAPSNHELVSIEGDTLIWHNEDVVFLQLNLNDVVVIGEFTNSNGHWFDDWFLAFVTKQGAYSSIPFYVKNREEVIQVLSQRFDPELKAVF
jgi:hypothetical protein